MVTPGVGRIVHYQAHGSPDGQHKPEARAAVITSVIDSDHVGLCVLNPTGIFFQTLVARDESETPKGGTWRWPAMVRP